MLCPLQCGAAVVDVQHRCLRTQPRCSPSACLRCWLQLGTKLKRSRRRPSPAVPARLPPPLPRLPRAGHWSPACRRSAPTYPLNMRSANQGKHSGKEKPSGQPSKRSGAITAVCVGGAVAASAAMALRPGGFLRGYLQDRWEDLEAIELEPGMKKVR